MIGGEGVLLLEFVRVCISCFSRLSAWGFSYCSSMLCGVSW